MDLNRSGTRKEDLLIEDGILQRVWLLRKVVQHAVANHEIFY